MPYIGQQPTNVAFLTDTFSGNGSTTAFTLSAAPANTSSILVAISGVLQDPSTYSVSGTTLTFSPAPPTGTGNISVRFLGIPASGVTTTAYRTVTEFTATSGQTTFSVPSYTPGFIDVYRNGVMLGSADYTATSGLSVVLVDPCTVGDFVEVISFSVSSVLNAIPNVPASVNTSNLVDGSVTTAKIADNAITTAKIAAGAVITADIADGAVTPAKLSQPLTSGTAVSASGTSIDFTGIPSWVKRITVVLNSVSTNGSSIPLLQIGAGSVTTSGYVSSAVGTAGAGMGTTAFTTGYGLRDANDSGKSYSGLATIALLGSNTWAASYCGNAGAVGANNAFYGGGAVTLGGTLDRVRLTTVNGTDAFDAGTINILYE